MFIHVSFFQQLMSVQRTWSPQSASLALHKDLEQLKDKRGATSIHFLLSNQIKAYVIPWWCFAFSPSQSQLVKFQIFVTLIVSCRVCWMLKFSFYCMYVKQKAVTNPFGHDLKIVTLLYKNIDFQLGMFSQKL